MNVKKYPYEQLTQDGMATFVRSPRKLESVRGACFMHAKKKPYRIKVAKVDEAPNEDGQLYRLWREDRA